jgi:hypothetical protein
MGESEIAYVADVSYVKRTNPLLATVGFDHARREFIWTYRPETA